MATPISRALKRIGASGPARSAPGPGMKKFGFPRMVRFRTWSYGPGVILYAQYPGITNFRDPKHPEP